MFINKKNVVIFILVNFITSTAFADVLKTSSKLFKLPDVAVRDVYSGIKFQYFVKEDRIKIINDFFQSIENEYSLLPLKKNRLGLNVEQMKIDALAIEESIPDFLLNKNEYENSDLKRSMIIKQAKGNLDFYDRMKLITAKFQDTHFSMRTRFELPVTYIGLRFGRIGNDIRLTALDSKYLTLVTKVTGFDFSKIKKGDTVLAIDGISVNEKINELKKFISCSSPDYCEIMAIKHLTMRDFNYDQKNNLTITLKNAGKIKLPWFYLADLQGTVANSLDAITYLKSIGVQSDAMNISLNYDSVKKDWEYDGFNLEGFFPQIYEKKLHDLKVFKNAKNEVVMRTGYFLKDGKSYGVLQLLSFADSKLILNGTSIDFPEAVRNFVSELKVNGTPLIFDLRRNGGGQIRFATILMSIFAQTNAEYSGITIGRRITPFTRMNEINGNIQEVNAEDVSNNLSIDMYESEFEKALLNRKDYIPMFNLKPIFPDSNVNGFDNKMVMLVSPECISTCDIMSYLLKSTKRATIIGTHANGTGAGFSDMSNSDTVWVDPYKVFQTMIPNILFGIPGSDINTRFFGEDSVYELDSENRPTVADINYNHTENDLVNDNIGWLNKAVEVIESAK